MIRAAGVMILSASGKLLFLRRSKAGDHAGQWCFPGGKIEDGETAEEAAIRELDEEAGVKAEPQHLTLWTRRCADDVDYTTFIVRNVAEFEPYLDIEHNAYLWAEPDRAPRPLHPGCEISIKKLEMDEFSVACAMRDGELTGPQQYENIWLFPMRITGTGMAFRHKWDEHVWRDPALYLNDHFLARCAGLPVILEHPKEAVLDTEEFRDRNVGSIMLPYIKGDEVWGIAKIYDADAASILLSEQLSTSPAVVWRDPDVNSEQEMENGQKFLIEGKPSLLDHLAICKQGVWDKGGIPEGIDLGGLIMADTAKPKVAADDANPSGMDRLLKGLEALTKKFDGLTTRMDSIEQKRKARSDDDDDQGDGKPQPPLPVPGAEGEGKAPPMAADKKKRKDAEPPPFQAKTKDVPPPPAADDEEEDGDGKKKLPPEFLKNVKDDDRKDDDDDMRGDDDDDNDDGDDKEDDKDKAADAGSKKVKWMGKDSAADGTVRVKSADLNALRRELAEVRSRLPKDRNDQDAAAMAEDQARCDSVALMFGTSAPRPLAGEERAAYRLRMLEPYKKHSANWKDVDLQVVAVDEAALGVVEGQIYAAAKLAARDPASVPVGTLRPVTTRSPTGHIETRFMGSPSTWLNRFAPNKRYVTAINLKKD
jgi:8-oxo-dGTP pyrophosphatase MutT (NUDIX family)